MRSRHLPAPLHVANETLAFLLELAMLAALGWWGATTGRSAALDVLLGVGAPLAVAVAWGLFAAPKARVPLPMAGVVAVKVLAYGSAVIAIAAMGRHRLAACFAVVAFVNTLVATMDRDAAVRTNR
jgi:Protein of unknown function (DUF2568)